MEALLDTPAFMSAGGEMGAMIRARDWAATPLGPPAGWPQGLKTALRMALTTRHPIFIFWGPELTCFYNDGYRPSLGPEKHPAILGAGGREFFPELWDIIGPQIELVMRGEGATWHENHLVPSFRHGRLDEVYWTYSYGPIDEETAPNGVGGVLVVCTETTEQVRTAEALRENQRALQALNDNLEARVASALAERRVLADVVERSDAFVVAADRQFRLLAINDAAAREIDRIYGVRPAVGDDLPALIAHMPAHSAAVRAVWQRAFDGETFDEVQPFGDAALARRFYEVRFSPLRDADGAVVGAYQFGYDVTPRLEEQARLAEAEEALRQSQKIEMLGQLTGGVAHDFNNLLTPVMGALDYARMALRDADAREIVAVGLQAAERARTLVQRLLAFARRQHLRPQPVDVAALAENMAEIALRSLPRGITLALDLPDDLPPARVDPDQLVMALLNLVINARDAIEADGGAGRIRVSACAVARIDPAAVGADVDAAGDGPCVRIDVVDDGAGMDEATLRRATEPFFTTKPTGKGTGLGLPSVHGLVLQSGGALRVASTPGEGTTATLWLPVAVQDGDAPPVQAPASDYAPQPAAPVRVLLVDDDDLVRASAAATLRRAGHRVTEVAGPAAALAHLRARADGFDLLLTDFAMPGMTGAELVAEARLLSPSLPALLATGFADLAHDEAAAVPRLAKPFRPNELLAAVASVLRRRMPDTGDDVDDAGAMR